MLKRTFILGMIATCFFTSDGFANNNIETSAPTYISHTSNNSNNQLELNTKTNAANTSWDSILRNQLPKDLIFKVVIGTFVEPLDIECSFLRKVRADMTVEKTTKGETRYAIGAFDEYQQAASHCEDLKTKGYRHAKVIAYNKEEALAIPVEQVLEWMTDKGFSSK